MSEIPYAKADIEDLLRVVAAADKYEQACHENLPGTLPPAEAHDKLIDAVRECPGTAAHRSAAK